MRYLHYVDSVVKLPIRADLEDLPEKSELIPIRIDFVRSAAHVHHVRSGGRPYPGCHPEYLRTSAQHSYRRPCAF